MSTKVQDPAEKRIEQIIKDGPSTNRLALGAFCVSLRWIRDEQLAGLIVGIFQQLPTEKQDFVRTAIAEK